MASVSGTAGRFAAPAVPAGIRDRASNIQTRERFFEPAEGAARLREAYEACTSAFSKSSRKAAGVAWLLGRRTTAGVVFAKGLVVTRQISHYLPDRMTCHILPR